MKTTFLMDRREIQTLECENITGLLYPSYFMLCFLIAKICLDWSVIDSPKDPNYHTSPYTLPVRPVKAVTSIKTCQWELSFYFFSFPLSHENTETNRLLLASMSKQLFSLDIHFQKYLHNNWLYQSNHTDSSSEVINIV